jgi:hypothetical protein
MWAKILAGVLAAGAVVGIGVYAALPPGGGECDRCGSNQNPPDCPTGGCCPLMASAPAAPPMDTTALAACTGGLATAEGSSKASSCTGGSCCGD